MSTLLEAVARLFKGVPERQTVVQPSLLETTQCAPLIGKFLRRHWRPLNIRSGHPNTFILICLSYAGLTWPEGGVMEIVGPKNDLLMFLRHVKYRHGRDTRQFLIFTDFEVTFEDHNGVSGTIPTIPATRENIAVRVQDVMRDLDREDKCVLYYGGHIDLDRPSASQGSAHLVVQDNERINDHELREWLNLSRFPTTTIMAIFDGCHSGGFLGLPYVYAKGEKCTRMNDATHDTRINSQVIEIASTTKNQYSFSEKFGVDTDDEATHGILTWYLLQYLHVNSRPDMHELVSHIYSKCDTLWQEWHQVPVLSSSRRISGRVAFF